MTNSIVGIGSLNSKEFCSLTRSSFYLSRSGEFENLLKILYAGIGAQPLNNQATASRSQATTLFEVPFQR